MEHQPPRLVALDAPVDPLDALRVAMEEVVAGYDAALCVHGLSAADAAWLRRCRTLAAGSTAGLSAPLLRVLS